MSQLDAQTKEIGGVTYEVRMLPATKAQKLLVRLGGMLGPALARIAGSDEGLDLEVGSEAFGEAVTALFASADEDKVDGVLKELASVTFVHTPESEGGVLLSKIYDVHFMGRVGALFQWAAFALGVQYADFFDALASVLGGAGLAGKVPGSASPTASTGASGAS